MNPMSADTSSSLRDRLRTSTASLHRSVDDIMGRMLRRPDGGYEHFLSLSARAIFPLERALNRANVTSVLPDWPQRSRTAALQSDLEALSIPAPTMEDLRNESRLHDEAYQFGVLYVLEGSRLGGRAILQNLLKVPEQARAHGYMYLSHGAGQPLWRTFLERLEASAAARRRSESAIAGAVATFERFVSCGQLDQ